MDKSFEQKLLDACKDKHISPSELCCHDASNTPYPNRYVEDGNLDRLINMFERFRKHLGNRPLIINCAYRTPEHNKEVGGSAHSQHLIGKALDIKKPLDFSILEFHTQTLRFADRNEIVGGVGLYNDFVHLDIRDRKPNGRYALWRGNY